MAGGEDDARAAWYPDPSDETQLRYYDGSTWTEHVSTATPAAPPSDVPPATDDLADNRPGAAARAKALESRRAAPVRTQVARMFGVHNDERAWRVGADGEEEVGKRLAKLGPDWRVLHAVPVGKRHSDIDHVVIGPPGVFTLNTKTHPGKHVWIAERAFLVSGQKTAYVRNSVFEADRARVLLSDACGFDVSVRAVIVVLAGKLTVKAQPAAVRVVARKAVVKWLRSLPPTLTAERVHEIYQQARRPETWRT